MKQIHKFLIIGTIGFLVDSLILLTLVHLFLLDITIARLFSFIFAVFVTWILNRTYTFTKSKYSKKKEYFYYLSVKSFGSLLNYTIFIILVKNYELFEKYLILPLAIASLLAMFFNFYVLRKKVFI